MCRTACLERGQVLRRDIVSDLEGEWLADALRGDPQAFSKLVETYQRPVYNLCYRMLGDPHEAEDAAQETFLRAYKGMSRYDRQRPFSTWLLSIAAHYCIDQTRKRRHTILSLEDSPQLDPPDHSPGPEASLSMNEDRSRIQALLETLSPQDRAAVVMYYWYDFSYKEIGQALALTESAVKSRLHRARRDMALRLTEQSPQAAALGRIRHESPAF